MNSFVRRLRYSFYRQRGFVDVEIGNQRILFSAKSNVRQALWLKKRLSRGEFEPDALKCILANVHEGDKVFEVGSWVGPYSILLSKLIGDGGKLFLFEPDPVARSLCDENLQLNRCRNYHLFPLALSDKPGLEFLYNDNMFGDSVSSLIPNVRQAPNKSRLEPEPIKIVTCRLDSFAQMINQWPDFVKIDVEGSEDLVIAGGQSVLSRQGVKIIMEIHSQFLMQRKVSATSVLMSLKALNKRVWLLDESGREFTHESKDSFTDQPRFHVLATD